MSTPMHVAAGEGHTEAILKLVALVSSYIFASIPAYTTHRAGVVCHNKKPSIVSDMNLGVHRREGHCSAADLYHDEKHAAVSASGKLGRAPVLRSPLTRTSDRIRASCHCLYPKTAGCFACLCRCCSFKQVTS